MNVTRSAFRLPNSAFPFPMPSGPARHASRSDCHAQCEPDGAPVDGPEYFKARLTDRLEQIAATHGLQSWRQSVAPKRDNLLIRIDGEPTIENGGALVLLEAHQDTVPVEGMTIAPFDPVLREGRVFGRGSCDNKGGLTAMLAAVVRIAETKPRPRPTVVLACTVNEEHGFTGAKALCGLWSDAEGHANLFSPSPRPSPRGRGSKSNLSAAAGCGDCRGADELASGRRAQRNGALAMSHIGRRGAQFATRARRKRDFSNGRGASGAPAISA